MTGLMSMTSTQCDNSLKLFNLSIFIEFYLFNVYHVFSLILNQAFGNYVMISLYIEKLVKLKIHLHANNGWLCRNYHGVILCL